MGFISGFKGLSKKQCHEYSRHCVPLYIAFRDGKYKERKQFLGGQRYV